jgi:hypothetical protein
VLKVARRGVRRTCSCGPALQFMILSQRASLPPEIPKPCWRQFRVAHRVLDIPVAEVNLHGSGVVALVGKRVAASKAQHVRMGLEAKTSLAPSPLDHASKASGGEAAPRHVNRCNTEATSGYPARPSQRLPHLP